VTKQELMHVYGNPKVLTLTYKVSSSQTGYVVDQPGEQDGRYVPYEQYVLLLNEVKANDVYAQKASPDFMHGKAEIENLTKLNRGLVGTVEELKAELKYTQDSLLMTESASKSNHKYYLQYKSWYNDLKDLLYRRFWFSPWALKKFMDALRHKESHY
jgi:hypothetical protein